MRRGTPAERQAVELHIVSDSTGETAARLVLALEAQFPEQSFEEVRHPRVETADDLQRAVARAKGRPAVMVYTLVEPGYRDAMRSACKRYRLHYCDLLRSPMESVARVSGLQAKMEPSALPPLDPTYFRRVEAMEFAVKILPATVQAAQMMAMIGQPFSVKAFLTRMAKDAGIEWLDEVFYDPEYQMMQAQMMMAGPQPQGSQGQAAKPGSTTQNGQPGQVMAVPSAAKLERQDQQQGANADQQLLKMGGY